MIYRWRVISEWKEFSIRGGLKMNITIKEVLLTLLAAFLLYLTAVGLGMKGTRKKPGDGE